MSADAMGSGAVVSGALGAVARAWRAFVWYVKGVLGENDYDQYVVHARAHGEAVLSVRDYWRERYAAQDHDPGGRCC